MMKFGGIAASMKRGKLRKNDERKQRQDVEVMASGYQPSKKTVELINHAFFVLPFSFFLALRQHALRRLSGDSAAGPPGFNLFENPWL